MDPKLVQIFNQFYWIDPFSFSDNLQEGTRLPGKGITISRGMGAS